MKRKILCPKRKKGSAAWRSPSARLSEELDVKGRTAPAGALDRRVVELEPGRLQGLNVIDHAAIEVHQRGGIDKDLQIVELEDLVHHARLVLKRHRILEPGATATHHANAQTGWQWILGRHDFMDLSHRLRRKRQGHGYGIKVGYWFSDA